MKKVIRYKIFETNSSSTHSVCIASGPCEQTLQPEVDGYIHIYPGGFGWDVEDYWDSETKASYAYTWCMNNCEDFDLLSVTMRDKLNLLQKVIEKQTGCKVKFCKNEEDLYQFGYVDHQSWENEKNCLAEAWSSEEKLTSFIFNKDSLLHIDHDNY